MVQEELKLKCRTTSLMSGTSVQLVNFSVALLILNEKLGEKKQQQRTRNPWKAMSHLRGLSHTSSYLY